MKKPVISTFAAIIAVSALFSSSSIYADYQGIHRYAVTITNLTRGQIFSPPAVIVHNKDFRLFTLGSPASTELATLAEEGAVQPLLSAVSALPSVYQTALGSGGILPGASRTIEIQTSGKFSEISVASMLISTNDAFMAVRGVQVPRQGMVSVEAEAYDAGSEANSENCVFIPGPPCGSHIHDSAAAEGYVHVHAGIHGGSGLTPAMHDWRNPVAQVEIKRVD